MFYVFFSLFFKDTDETFCNTFHYIYKTTIRNENKKLND